MELEDINIPSDFIFDIASIPGSSEEVCQLTIEHYQKQLDTPDLHPKLREIASGIISALTQYYRMANFESEDLRNILPHLSEASQFMESKATIDVDVESAGRIKSFYSTYVKIIDDITSEYIEKDKPLPEKGFFLEDIWATRDILRPRHDMRTNIKAFYKATYGLILNFMEYIDKLSNDDPRYGLKEYEKSKMLDLQKPKKYSFPPEDTVIIPEKTFLEYAFEIKKVPDGFKYLPDNLNAEELKNLKLQIKNFQESSSIGAETALYRYIVESSKVEQLIQHRNTVQSQFLEKTSAEVAKDLESLPFDDFFAKNKFKVSSLQRDELRYLNYLNNIISNNKVTDPLSIIINRPDIENNGFFDMLKKVLNDLEKEQDRIIKSKLYSIEKIDLDNFEKDYAEAQKLKRFNRCAKDYMRYPKQTGYQSFHMIVQTPYGEYEKQIRTEAQDNFAEFGHASHSNSYKPDVKSTFHRLKVTTAFSPKRDEKGDIISPTQLGILPFELAVYNYYKQPFSNFSGGKTLAQFKEEHKTKEEYDNALLALSPVKVSQNLITKLWNKVFHKTKPETAKITTQSPTLTAYQYSDVPQDISAYPNISVPSTDDEDPHGDR